MGLGWAYSVAQSQRLGGRAREAGGGRGGHKGCGEKLNESGATHVEGMCFIIRWWFVLKERLSNAMQCNAEMKVGTALPVNQKQGKERLRLMLMTVM